MKKFFTIGFSVLLLLAEMHVALAIHFCGGELADTRISLTGQTASCGMTHDSDQANSGTTISSICCKDESFVYKVDENYSLSESGFLKLPQFIQQDIFISGLYTSFTNYALYTVNTNLSPPGWKTTRTPAPADICVFRI